MNTFAGLQTFYRNVITVSSRTVEVVSLIT